MPAYRTQKRCGTSSLTKTLTRRARGTGRPGSERRW